MGTQVGRVLDKRMKASQLFAFLIIASACLSTISACCCDCFSSCRCNTFCCDCSTHDGGYCYYDGESSDSGPCHAYNYEWCAAYNTKQIFNGWDLNKDGMISADEALAYGNLTITEFLMADKDQNGFVFPSEFDSDLAEFDSDVILA